MKSGFRFVLLPLFLAMLFFLAAVNVRGAGQADKGKVLPAAVDGKNVKLHYTLTVDGKEIDSSKDKSPFVFRMGAHQVVPGFEKAVAGMKAGEKKAFRVSPADGYGEENPKAIKEIPRARLPENIKPEAGMTLYAKGASGRPMPVKIMKVKKDVVVMNFNHPLAGKNLDFDIEVLEVFDSPPEKPSSSAHPGGTASQK